MVKIITVKQGSTGPSLLDTPNQIGALVLELKQFLNSVYNNMCIYIYY